MTRLPPPLGLTPTETAADGIRRIVGELIDDAIWRLENADTIGTAIAVHETRKRCKEARGVIRLARGGLGEQAYKAANGTLRDAARLLSDLRDRQAMLDTFDALVNASVGSIPAGGVGTVRSVLRDRALEAGRPTELRRSKVTATHRMLQGTRAQIAAWEFDREDDRMLATGLRVTYARARSAMAESEATGDPHVFHDWRKRVKYGWYHAQVLEPAAPSVLTPLAEMRHRLSDGLGGLHDLEVILERARLEPAELGGSDQIAALEGLVGPMQRELERRVLGLGHRLYSEPADAHVDRMLGYLDAWRNAGAELQVGEIGELFVPQDDLNDLTKGELRTLAAEAGIKGRWSMGRDELLAALRASGRVP